jgi:transposase
VVLTFFFPLAFGTTTMGKRQLKKPKKLRHCHRPPDFQDTAAPLVVQNPHAAGIDVHSDLHVVCVGPGLVREFGAYTADLHALVAYLRGHAITTVAMESTGVYWIPLYELLEAEGFEVNLVAPGHLKHCGARPKTDVLDAQWIQRLHTYGLLRGSFRPPDDILPLRAYWRQRHLLIRLAAMHVQHMQKALEQMNVKLTEVLSDITGVTGLLIIKAILDGERDPQALARFRHEQCAKSKDEIAQALAGSWRPEHLFELQQAYELFQFYQQKVGECDRRLAAELDGLPNRAGAKGYQPRPRERGRKKNDLRFEASGPLFQALGVDLTQIPGVDVATALVVLAEIGVDVSRFPTEKHFASWLGLCPRDGRSNEAPKKRAPRKGRNRLAQALRMAAQAVGRTQTVLGLFYRRIRSRIGGKGAVTATAHKMAVLIYRMVRHGTEYVATSLEEYEARMRAKLMASLQKKAAALGYQLTPKATAPPG